MAYSEKKQGKLHKISDKRPPWKPTGNYTLDENGNCGCTDNSELLKEIRIKGNDDKRSGSEFSLLPTQENK